MLELLNQMDGFDAMGDVKVGTFACSPPGWSASVWPTRPATSRCYLCQCDAKLGRWPEGLASSSRPAGSCGQLRLAAPTLARQAPGALQVIMATNRIESLDPALIRPGRIDRKIEFPLPDTKTKRRIFNIHTGKMTLAPDVNLEEFIMAKVRVDTSRMAHSWQPARCAVPAKAGRPVQGQAGTSSGSTTNKVLGSRHGWHEAAAAGGADSD